MTSSFTEHNTAPKMPAFKSNFMAAQGGSKKPGEVDIDLEVEAPMEKMTTDSAGAASNAASGSTN